MRKQLIITTALCLLALSVATLLFVPSLPSRLAVPPSVVVEYREGTPAHVFLAPDERWRVYTRRSEIDPAYLQALLALEDKRFYLHRGVDPLAVARAALQNLTRGRRVSGASTLTLQLVRMLEPRPRTLGSKIVEALRAFQLEARLSKTEILEAYLQFVPYGRNVEGVEAAALAYFGHRATHLSPAEIALLLAVPQNPNRRFPTPANAARLASSRNAIAQKLLSASALPLGPSRARMDPSQVLRQVQDTPVPRGLKPFPREAPHAAIWLRDQHPRTSRIRTTLDAGTQRLAEQALHTAAPELNAHGIHNGSIVVIEHGTAEIRALVGSLDFFDPAHGGQWVGFATPRSPGSALKPLLYALGIDRGLISPEHVVPDVPTSYGAYTPHNFDGRFQGLVRMEDALSQSLNLPFVQLLQRIGVEPFLATLRRAGVTSLVAEPGHYGLSAAVGGIEITPLELAQLYALLAQEGRATPLRILQSAPAASLPVISPGAAWLTRRALALRDRPDFPERRRMNGLPSRLHWKTGTSFGHRDAWAAGSGPTHTAVVWLGNVDNTPSAHLVGAENAAPLLFDILEALAPPPNTTERDAAPPSDLIQVELCAYSGHLPTEACPERRHGLVRKTSVPTAPCPYHLQMEVDVSSGLAVTPSCREGRITEERTFLSWPATVRRWLDSQHRLLPLAPEFAPGCAPAGLRAAPSIVSPAPGQVALLLPGVAADQQEVPFEAEADTARTLSWFVDGAFLGTAQADEQFWWKPSPGTHEILVSDEQGLSAKRLLVVRERK